MNSAYSISFPSSSKFTQAATWGTTSSSSLALSILNEFKSSKTGIFLCSAVQIAHSSSSASPALPLTIQGLRPTTIISPLQPRRHSSSGYAAGVPLAPNPPNRAHWVRPVRPSQSSQPATPSSSQPAQPDTELCCNQHTSTTLAPSPTTTTTTTTTAPSPHLGTIRCVPIHNLLANPLQFSPVQLRLGPHHKLHPFHPSSGLIPVSPTPLPPSPPTLVLPEPVPALPTHTYAPILSQSTESAKEEAADVRAREADFVLLDTDGEEEEYAEFTEEQLLQEQIELKAQLAALAENDAQTSPDLGNAEKE